jgi:DNA invertase Pin-like site-specific DNA recombinase
VIPQTAYWRKLDTDKIE